MNQKTWVGRYFFPSRAWTRATTSSADTFSTPSSRSWKLIQRPPGRGGEQQEAVRTARDSGLVARKGRGHRDVGDEELSAIRGALERLVHRMARDAVGAARADDRAWAHRLRLAVRVDELDEDLVAVGLHLGRGDAALDHPAERGEMGLEDAVSYCGRLHWNLQRQSMPSCLIAPSSIMSGP